MAWPPEGPLPPGVDPTWPRVLRPFVAPQNVSTETPLMALTSFGRNYKDLVFTIRNLDPVNKIVVYIDRAQSGVSTNSARDIATVGPLHEGDLVFRDLLSLFWALSAAGDPDGGFPTCSVSWTLVGRRRDYA